jgi:hypothetical protein
MTPTALAEVAARGMGQRLTVPFARGADTLELQFATADAGRATVALYDFTFNNHAALFGHAAEPRYIVTLRRDLVAATTLRVVYEIGDDEIEDDELSVEIAVPALTVAGTSFAVSLGTHEGPGTRIVRLEAVPALPAQTDAHGGPAPTLADWWRITALLGNMAKLLWVIGAELDQLSGHLRLAQSQRHLARAVGPSLDWIGADLGVPRFPPRPHAVDADTIALYHLDDAPAPGADPPFQDAVRVPGATPGTFVSAHPGKNVGGLARPGAVGRFGGGFTFDVTDALLTVDSSPDFDVAATASFTVECFVRPGAMPTVREGVVVARPARTADAVKAGWALSVGAFGLGLPRLGRFSLTDGTPAHNVEILSVEQLDTARFHHLAGVVDRAAQVARLYVDGVLVGSQSLAGPGGTLGALANTGPLQIGGQAVAGEPPFQGIVDEVRLSRGARTSFEPALGEADESYRARLQIFQRWTVPTRAEIERVLNEAAGPIGNDPAPLIVADAHDEIVSGSLLVNVAPAELSPRESMDGLGNRRVREADVCGTAAEERSFDPGLLVRHDDSRAAYASPEPRVLLPGEPAPDPHRMQTATARCLNRLLDLLEEAAPTGTLRVRSAFDPRAPDLRAVGRGLLLTYPFLAPGPLAALALRAGFSFVEHRSQEQAAYASVAPSEYVEIEAQNGADVVPVGTAVVRGTSLTLQVQPILAAGLAYRWSAIACGGGQASLTVGADTSRCTLLLIANGSLTIKVAASRNGHTITATRVLRIVEALPEPAPTPRPNTVLISVVATPAHPDGEPELVERETLTLGASPTSPAGSRVVWSVRGVGPGQGHLSHASGQDVSLTGDRAGQLLVSAIYAREIGPQPFTFDVRLKDALQSLTIGKHTYDRIMNVLNTLHPIGVEVTTHALRDRVVEVREDPLSAFPAYTYPDFRARGRRLPRRPARKE